MGTGPTGPTRDLGGGPGLSRRCWFWMKTPAARGVFLDTEEEVWASPKRSDDLFLTSARSVRTNTDAGSGTAAPDRITPIFPEVTWSRTCLHRLPPVGTPGRFNGQPPGPRRGGPGWDEPVAFCARAPGPRRLLSPPLGFPARRSRLGKRIPQLHGVQAAVTTRGSAWRRGLDLRP